MEIVFHLVSLFLILYLCIGLIVLYLRTKCSNYSVVWLHSTTSKVLSLSLFRLLVYFCCPLYSFDCFFFCLHFFAFSFYPLLQLSLPLHLSSSSALNPHFFSLFYSLIFFSFVENCFVSFLLGTLSAVFVHSLFGLHWSSDFIFFCTSK